VEVFVTQQPRTSSRKEEHCPRIAKQNGEDAKDNVDDDGDDDDDDDGPLAQRIHSNNNIGSDYL